MKRKIAMKILFFSIFYILCFFIIRLYSAEAANEAQVNSENQPLGVVVRPKEEFDAVRLRDPFRDYLTEDSESEISTEIGVRKETEVSPPSLIVQGIISGGRINQAIINNKIVKVGDTIEDAIITNIDKNGITISFSNKSYKISSPAAEILQESKKKPEGGSDEK